MDRETAAAENSSSYFPLLDRIAAGHFASASTDAALYAQVLDALQEDGSLSSPEALSTFKLALSLRSAAPRIEAHYQYYATAVASAVDDAAEPGCTNWVLLEGKQYCTPELDKVHREGLSSLSVSARWHAWQALISEVDKQRIFHSIERSDWAKRPSSMLTQLQAPLETSMKPYPKPRGRAP